MIGWLGNIATLPGRSANPNPRCYVLPIKPDTIDAWGARMEATMAAE